LKIHGEHSREGNGPQILRKLTTRVRGKKKPKQILISLTRKGEETNSGGGGRLISEFMGVREKGRPRKGRKHSQEISGTEL